MQDKNDNAEMARITMFVAFIFNYFEIGIRESSASQFLFIIKNTIFFYCNIIQIEKQNRIKKKKIINYLFHFTGNRKVILFIINIFSENLS